MISGTTAVAAAEKADRKANKMPIYAWRIFLVAASLISFPFASLEGRKLPSSKALLAEVGFGPAKVTQCL